MLRKLMVFFVFFGGVVSAKANEKIDPSTLSTVPLNITTINNPTLTLSTIDDASFSNIPAGEVVNETPVGRIQFDMKSNSELLTLTTQDIGFRFKENGNGDNSGVMRTESGNSSFPVKFSANGSQNDFTCSSTEAYCHFRENYRAFELTEFVNVIIDAPSGSLNLQPGKYSTVIEGSITY